MAVPFSNLDPNIYGTGSAGLEIVALLACICISILSYRCYGVIKQKKYFYFSLAFFFIAISFIARIVAHLSLYVFDAEGTLLKLILSFSFGSLFYILLTLLGYLIMLVVVCRSIGRSTILLIF